MTVKENWKPVTISGMTGILMGAGTMYASQVLATDNASVVESSEQPLHEASVGGCKSFRDAFQAARAELGPGGVFRWHGNIYNTYTVEEWNAMSTEEKNLFAQRVKPKISPSDIDTNEIAKVESADEDVQVVSVQEEDHVAKPQVVTEEPAPAKSDDEDDVRVIGFGDVDLADGRSVTVEELEINGQRVAVIDVDKDGVGDFAMSDLNHNNQADEGEVIDLHTGDVISFHNDQTAMDDSAADVDMIPV